MSRTYSEKKLEYFERITGMLKTYRRMLFVEVDNVKSQQMHNIRRALRGKAEIVMGKNTQMRKIISMLNYSDKATPLNKALFDQVIESNRLVGNLGIVFTNEDFTPILDVIKANRVNAPARVGSISPVNVVIPAGNTGMEPGATSFFQALSINTKIVKGTVEIVTEKKVLSIGDRVDNSTAALLHKLNIKPFFYGLLVNFVFDNGDVYDADVLEMSNSIFEDNLTTAIKNLTSISLAVGIPTELSLPHTSVEAFKNLLAISLGTGYTFDEFKGKEIVEAIKSGKSLGAPAAGPAAAAAAPAAKAPEPEEEEDDDMGLGLFD